MKVRILFGVIRWGEGNYFKDGITFRVEWFIRDGVDDCYWLILS